MKLWKEIKNKYHNWEIDKNGYTLDQIDEYKKYIDLFASIYK